MLGGMADFGEGPPLPPLTLEDLFRAGANPEILAHQVELPRGFYQATGYTHVTIVFAFERHAAGEKWTLFARATTDIPAPLPEAETRDKDVRFANLEID